MGIFDDIFISKTEYDRRKDKRQIKSTLKLNRLNREAIAQADAAADRELTRQQKKSLIPGARMALAEAGVTDNAAWMGAGYQLGSAKTSTELAGANALVSSITGSTLFSTHAKTAADQAKDVALAAQTEANRVIQVKINDEARAAAAEGRAQDLHTLAVAEKKAKAAAAVVTAAHQKSLMPDRTTINVIEPGSGAVVPRTVDSPSSTAYGTTLAGLQDVFAGAAAAQELSELIGKPEGTEYVGARARRMQGLHSSAVLGYAKRQGMGALQAPDLEIASGVIPNPTKWDENLAAIGRSTVGAVLGLVGAESVTRAAQLKGMQAQYAVATDDMYTAIVKQLLRNPLMLADVSDDELARIPPEIADPLMDYLQNLGRDPWK